MGFLDATGITTLVNKLKTKTKTINNESVWGSGNVAVQPTLVSGTNIKTVNNESLLGSGNIRAITTWYGTSSTTASTAAKVVTCSGFTLQKGAIIAVLFSTANTAATPTLNVNSTGAKSIYIGSSTPNSTTNVLKWSANTLVVFMYDGSYYRYITAVSAASVASSTGASVWYGTSSTASTTAAKTSTIDNYKLTKGSLVNIQFSTANTYTSDAITLNINSTGEKTIYINNAATSSSNNLLWDAGDVLQFVYDGSYYRFVSKQSDSVDPIPMADIADAVEEGWCSSILTDLTGTTWILNDTLDILIPQTLYLYFFNIEFDYYLNGNVAGHALKFYFDAANNVSTLGYDIYTYLEEYTIIYSRSRLNTTWTNSGTWYFPYKQITFTGGAQVQNATLIAWLQENATQIIPQTSFLIVD